MSSPTPTASPSPPAVNPPASSPPPVVSSSPPLASSPPPVASSPPPEASSPPPVVAASPPPASISPPLASSPPPVPPLTPPPVVSPPAPPISDPPPPILPPPAPPISTPPPETPVSPPPPSSSPPPPTPVLPPPSSSSPPPAKPVLPPPPSSSPPPENPVQTPPPASSPPLATPPEPQPPSAPPLISTPSTPVAPSGELPPPLGETPSTPSISSDSPPPPSFSSSSSSTISPPAVVGIAVAGVALVALLSFLFCCYKRKKRSVSSPSPNALPPMPPPRKEEAYGGQPQNLQRNFPPPDDHIIKMPPPAAPPTIDTSSSGSILFPFETKNPPPKPLIPLGHTKSTFSYEELVMATDGFSDANLLGQGGFGYVHRGVLPNGQEVAVKQLKSGSGQGEREFQAEVEIISRVHHKHLVTLVGYSMAGSKRLLVYEFVPNNTLEFHLHGKGRPTMDWPNRLRIALGSAKGLAYLHEDCHPKIIHRDIKAANILLDYNFEAKVADFGLAKIASDGHTHVSTRVIGTFGYLSPEYAATGKLTDKSDVFSFGVMLLELITGRRPVDPTNTVMDESLVDWARPLLTKALEDGNFDGLVDPKLQNNYNATELSHMAVCAAAAVRHSAKHRPRMSQIVRALEGDASLEELNAGIRPGQSSIYASHSSSDYDDGQYKEDMKRFKILALTSEEFEDPVPTKNASRSGDRRESMSSDCSAATSEYGQNPSGSSSEGSPSRETKSPRTKNSVD